MQTAQTASLNSKATPMDTTPEAKAAQLPKKPKEFVGDYETAPEYMKDNLHITHGYRINFDTPRKILRSFFMLHNESVNIWSHCIPFILIIVVLCSFIFFIDPHEIEKSLSQYSKDISQSVDHYSQALNNLTILSEYQKFSEMTIHELQEIKNSAIKSYGIFADKVTQSSSQIKNLLETEVEGIKSSLKESLEQKLRKFQKLKLEFEHTIAPALVNEFNQQFDSESLLTLKQKLQSLKEQIDSQSLALFSSTPNPHHISKWPIIVFLLSASACLLTSTLFHLFYPMSSRTYIIFNRFDYAGINILISGSAFPPFYYSMYCNFDTAIVYLSCIMTIAISLTVLCVFEWIHRPENIKWKVFCFGGFGVSMMIPTTHILINQFLFDNYGDQFKFDTSLPYLLLLGTSYLTGLYTYAKRCPQRNNPGKYNLCGHSHQIWHGFVVLGIIFTYMCAISSFQMRKVSVCPA